MVEISVTSWTGSPSPFQRLLNSTIGRVESRLFARATISLLPSAGLLGQRDGFLALLVRLGEILVAHRPDDDTGVVLQRLDHLVELRLGLVERARSVGFAQRATPHVERNLGHVDDAALVAQLIVAPVERVVATEGVGAQPLGQIDLLRAVGLGERAAGILVQLVDVQAP